MRESRTISGVAMLFVSVAARAQEKGRGEVYKRYERICTGTRARVGCCSMFAESSLSGMKGEQMMTKSEISNYCCHFKLFTIRILEPTGIKLAMVDTRSVATFRFDILEEQALILTLSTLLNHAHWLILVAA
jgi:hypothetical protein